jgi:uncharacterized membrane protein
LITGKEKGGSLFSSPVSKIHSKTFLFIIFLIFILTLFLRIYKIDDKNLWFDEVYSWEISTEPVKKIIELTSADIHPPFYYIILRSWTGIFGDSIFSMRMLSVIFSLLSFILIFYLSLKFIPDRNLILFILLLFAVSPLNIYYSQEVRMQNLNLFLCLGSVLFFFNFIERGKTKTGIIYTAFTILALYTHYFSFLILLTQVLLVIFYYFRNSTSGNIVKKYLLFFFIINILYIPWYPVMLSQVITGQPWREPQNFIQVSTGLINFIKDIFLSKYIYYENSAILTASTLFGLAVLFLTFYIILRYLNKTRERKFEIIKIFSFFIIPLLIALVISTSQHLFLSRYLSITLPFLLISLVFLIFNFYKKFSGIILVSVLLITSCYGAYINYDNNFKNNDYRKIISYLDTNFNEGDNIIVEPHFNGWIINYYNLHNNTSIKDPLVLGWNLDMQVDSLRKRDDLKNIWFILDYSSLEKSNYDSLSVYMKESGYERRSEKYFYPFPAKVKVEYYEK